MKSLYKFLTPGLALFLVVFVLIAQQKDAFQSRAELEIDRIHQKYGDNLLLALYSIDEIRPFMILHVDKVIDNYNKKWMSPSEIVSMLNAEDKKIALAAAIEFVDDIKDFEKRNQFLDRLSHWCMASNQFNFLRTEFGYQYSDLFHAARNVKYTMELPEIQSDLELNPSNTEKAMITLNNQISNLTMKQQIRYYGEIYWKLSEIEKR
jgi:hypothetical protein